MKRRKRVAAKVAATRLITPTGVEPVKIVTPFLKLIFLAGKLSDVIYVPPWLMSKWVAGNVDFAQRPVVISISKQGRCHHADFVLDGPLQMALQVIVQIVTNCN